MCYRKRIPLYREIKRFAVFAFEGPDIVAAAQHAQGNALMIHQRLRLGDRMLRQIVRRGEDAGAKAGKGAGDEIFILWLKGAYQQIAVAIKNGAVFLFPLAGVAGDQIDL